MSLQMPGTPCLCSIVWIGWVQHAVEKSIWDLSLSHLVPILFPTLLSAEHRSTRVMLVSVIFSSASWKDKDNEHKLNYRNFHLNTVKNIFYCEWSQTQEQVAYKGYWVSMLGDAWNLIGSMQPALAEPASRRGVGPDHLQRSLSTTSVHWFCEPE